MRVFVTGTSGFIGFHLARRLLELGHFVDGYDGMTSYYDLRLKEARRAILLRSNGFRDTIAMLEDMDALTRAVEACAPDVIVHLAAQAGVRYSLENPRAYVDANLVGTFNVMELARIHSVGHFLIASTSSVYGANPDTPFVESDRTDHPLTLYAATKKANEAMAHSYAHLWSIPTTLFRFFTVYGPWGRPDMAPLKFVEAIECGRAIDIYNHGDMERDFTYIDDLIEAVVRLIDCPPGLAPEAAALDHAAFRRNRLNAENVTDSTSIERAQREIPVPTFSHRVLEGDTLSPVAPYRIVNIGRGEPVKLLDFIDAIERKLGKKAVRNYLDMQPGDMRRTFADSSLLERLTGYCPSTSIEAGVSELVDWFRNERARLISSA
jgi:UDP-glucuronate 4-epimerase